MTWVTPKSWTVGEKPKASDLNTYMRDNMTHVRDLHRVTASTQQGIVWTTNSTAFVNWNGTSPHQLVVAKRWPTTSFVVLHILDYYLQGTAGNLVPGINANGTDWPGTICYKNELVSHHQIAMWYANGFGSGWAAGNYTITARIRVGGAATTFSSFTECVSQMAVWEVP